MLRLLLLVFIAFVVLTVVAFKLLGWGGLAVMALLIVVAAMIIKRLAVKALQSLMTSPFKIKGAVLKNADVRVHGVTPTAAPTGQVIDARVDDDDQHSAHGLDDFAPAELNWYHMDVTITPGQSSGPMTMWEPGELVLASPLARGGDLAELEALDEVGSVRGLQIWEDGGWQEDEGYKFGGPQRLRLLAGVKPGIRQVKLRYYFEVFGSIEIPGAHDALKAPPDA